MSEPIYIATRGSALALAQANQVKSLCQAAFPKKSFELKIIKTTGDKLQTAPLADPNATLPKGLFTKEIEEALLAKEATIAVHSLKDLPTELPDGLRLGATLPREDARDVLIVQSSLKSDKLDALPDQLVVATSSPRRQRQLGHHRPGWQFTEIRGNVGTRLRKVSESDKFQATVLAAAGMKRLGYSFEGGKLSGPDVPDGLNVFPLPLDWMIPAVAQAAIGIETGMDDSLADELCAHLNHSETWHAVTAERSFLRAMGGGCLSPVAAHASIKDSQLMLQAVSFQTGRARYSSDSSPIETGSDLGSQLAKRIDA